MRQVESSGQMPIEVIFLGQRFDDRGRGPGLDSGAQFIARDGAWHCLSPGQGLDMNAIAMIAVAIT
jgi:hypothetical protein